MISKKTISRLLAGASLATLGLAASSRASAASLTSVTTGAYTWTTDTDFLNINNSDIGVFTNEAEISDGLDNPGTDEATAVIIDTDTTIGEFINNDIIQAVEDADGNNFSTDYATAVAFESFGDVGLLTNNSLIDAYAFAHDLSSSTNGYADVYAYATGVYLYPDGDTSTDVTNNGALSAFAGVHVESTGVGGDAYGWAEASGVYQAAFDLGGGPHALNFTNTSTGDLDVDVDVQVFADDYAEGGGEAYGVYQYASQMDSAEAVANNYSGFNVQATSNVVAVYGGAANTYTGAVGIWQDLDVDDAETLARASVLNEAEFYVGVDADADITNGYYATALGGGLGVYQDVQDGDETSAEFENIDSFTVAVDVDAIYSFAGTYAGAQAYGTGVWQELSGDGATTVTGDFTSSGDFVVAANGYAKGQTYAVAGANGSGVYQEGWSADETRLSSETSGTFSVMSHAEAESDTYAFASYVDVSYYNDDDFRFNFGPGAYAFGVSQYAEGYDLAENSQENSGEFYVAASAKAVSNSWVAVGGAQAYGTYQGAAYADTVRNTAINSSDFTVVSDVEVDGEAFGLAANLHLSNNYGDWRLGVLPGAQAYGAVQYADSDGGDLAENIRENSGTLNVGAMADASGYLALASARAVGTYQVAENAYMIGNSALNTGDFSVYSSATAEGDGVALVVDVYGEHDEDDDYWYFDIDAGAQAVGVEQYVNDAAYAANSYDNQGDFMVAAEAKAVATTYLALGGAAASGVYQQAWDTEEAGNSFTNSGLFSVSSAAEIEGGAVAITADLGFFYYYGEWELNIGDGVDSYGLEQDAGGEYLAENSAESSSDFFVSANAKASATLLALAAGSAVGVNQDAYDGDVARNAFSNTAPFTVVTQTTAEAFGLAVVAEVDAYGNGDGYWEVEMGPGAQAYGVEQDAYGDDLAENTVTNAAEFVVSAYGKASGTYAAFGAAEASGVDQDSNADIARNTFTNSSAFSVVSAMEVESYGIALGATLDFGDDEGFWWRINSGSYARGVDQFADSDEYTAENAYSNASDFLVSSSVKASSQTYIALGVATAIGVEQDVEDGVEARNRFDNSGAFTVMAGAEIDGFFAVGSTYVQGVEQDVGSYSDGDLAENTFANTGEFYVSGVGKASGTYAAFAFGSAGGVDQAANGGLTARNTFSNTSTFSVLGTSEATANFLAMAATYVGGVSQYAYADTKYDGETLAENTFSNTSDFLVSAVSTADATYAAGAANFAQGVSQYAEWGNNTLNSYENSGQVTVAANATAEADFFAEAGASAFGTYQAAWTSFSAFEPAALARNTYDNSGTIGISAYGDASGGILAEAGADAAGLYQYAQHADTSENIFGNSGVYGVSAEANAVGGFAVRASAGVFGIGQSARGNYGTNSSTGMVEYVQTQLAQNMFTNTGDINLTALAKATGATYDANAFVYGGGVEQSAEDAALNYNQFVNDGSFNVSGSAEAKADFAAFAASRGFYGVEQYAEGDQFGQSSYATYYFPDKVENSFTNNGSFGVSGEAIAGGFSKAGATYADASMYVRGVEQGVSDSLYGLNYFHNTGSLQVAGSASATGDLAEAYAGADGYISYADHIRGTYTAKFRNDEDAEIVAMASAEAIGKDYGFASAYAYGVEFNANNYYEDPENYWNPDLAGASLNLDGKNKGVIYSMAQASASADSAANEYAVANAFGVAMFSDTGITGQFTNSGPGSITAEAYATGGDGMAWAVGVFDPSTANDAKILNKGDITAYAEGPNAYATGIAVAGAQTYEAAMIRAVDPGSAQAQITNNGGSIWAGVSTDGGETIYRGNAINTDGLVVGEGDAEVTLYEAAPNEVVVTLKNTRSDEAAQIFGNIDITDDDTVRVIKGWTRLDGIVNPDDELSGDLTISKDGKLTLANTNDLEGPSKVYVDTFAVKKKGTLNFEMTPDSAPMVKANSGKLKGTFAATYLPDFYGKKAVYNNAIELDERTGKFAKVVDNSYVIDTKLRYDGNDNVDLIVKRSGFGDTDGLNGNQQAVGDAIESVYKDLNGKGDFSDMVQNLTLIDNKSGYEDALNQLTGAEYAQLAQSVLWSTTMLNSSVTDRMDCGLNWTPGAGSNGERGPDACFEPGTFQMWGRISGSWNNMDGDSYAPGFDESQGGFYVGGDYAVNDNVFVGLAGGYFTSDMDFDSWGGRGGASFNYDGGQIALYGGWDNSQSYFRNILSYGFYNGSSHRDVGIGSSPVDPSGSYDANVWSYYGEVGHRFAVVDEVSATPFFGLGLATADIGSFVEKDPLGTGAGLKITGTDANSTATHLGVRVNGNWGAFSPEAYLAWKHEFSGTRQGVNATFASAPKGASFKVKGSDPGADALLLGLGGAISVGDSSDIVVRYDGAFYNGYNSQAGTVRWTTKF